MATLRIARKRFGIAPLAAAMIPALCGCRAPAHAGRRARQGDRTLAVALSAAEACAAHADEASSDPLEFLKKCRARYVAGVVDYRCRFTTRERIGGVLGPEQEMDVRFRERPYSVHVRWLRNGLHARRVSYVSGRWVRAGRELFLVEPAGWLGLLFPGGVKRDIHGIEAKAAARRTIDQFGFKKTLDWIIHYCERARGEPKYALRYVGLGTIGGRPTHVIERKLPFDRPDDPYPNRLLVIHIDCQWLVPTGCFAYADEAGEQLLGRYVSTDVAFNIGLTDEDF